MCAVCCAVSKPPFYVFKFAQQVRPILQLRHRLRTTRGAVVTMEEEVAFWSTTSVLGSSGLLLSPGGPCSVVTKESDSGSELAAPVRPVKRASGYHQFCFLLHRLDDVQVHPSFWNVLYLLGSAAIKTSLLASRSCHLWMWKTCENAFTLSKPKFNKCNTFWNSIVGETKVSFTLPLSMRCASYALDLSMEFGTIHFKQSKKVFGWCGVGRAWMDPNYMHDRSYNSGCELALKLLLKSC